MLSGVVRLIANHRPSTSSKARLKQGSFPPPALPGFSSTMTLSDSHRVRIAASMELTLQPQWVSHVARITFLRRAMPTTPADRMEAVDTFCASVRPSPILAGRHPQLHFRGPAQASLALWPTASLDRPRRSLSRGFDPASCPATPLVSFRSYRLLSGWNPPPQVMRALVAHQDARGPMSLSDWICLRRGASRSAGSAPSRA